MKSIVICVSESKESVEKIRVAALAQSSDFRVYTQDQWKQMTANTALAEAATFPVLAIGGAQIIPFPTAQQSKPVKTMAQAELETIQAAVAACKGNLTEAAKALGIGRATLYRKLKEFSIDPVQARSKKAA